MRLLKNRKGLSALSGLLVSAMLWANTGVAAAAGTAAAPPGSYSAVKAVEINVLPGAAALNPLLSGVTGAVGSLLNGVIGENGLLGGVTDAVGGLLGGVTETVGGLLGGLTGGLLGGSSEGSGGLLGGLLGSGSSSGIVGGALVEDPVGTVTGVVDNVVGGLDLTNLLQLGPTSVEVGVTKSEFEGASGSYGDTYPLSLQLLGGPKVIPLQVHATRDDSPKTQELLTADLGLVKAGLLTGAIDVTSAKAEAKGTIATADLAGLVTVGAVESSAVSTAYSADAELKIADVSVAGLVTLKALHAKAHASLTGEPKVEVDTVELNVAGSPITLQIGDVIEIPGIAKVGLLDGTTVKTADRAEAHGGVLEIELLGAVLGGISVRIGAVDAVVNGEAGPPYSLSKKALQDTVEPGGTITYNLVYNMNYAAKGVKVSDTLPAGTSFQEASGNGKYDPATNSVTWDLGNLAAEAGGVLTLKVTVDPGALSGTIIRNVAVISAPDHPPVDSNTEQVQVGSKVHIPFMIGFPDGTFRPYESVTRGQIAAMVSRLLELQNLSNTPVPYTDVAGHWAKPYIAAATAKGIFRGEGATGFAPDRPATRAEIAATLVRMYEITPVAFAKLPGASATFADVSSGHWAYNEIETAVRLGFLQGYADGTFRPDEPVTRAEVAAMFSKALGRGPLTSGKAMVRKSFSDVGVLDWFYGWVEEASKAGHKGVYVGGGIEALETYLDDLLAW